MWVLQFIRFLRRTEGVEAARKYFLDARKSPNCTYHVYVAQAMMEFCLNKDAKVTSDPQILNSNVCLWNDVWNFFWVFHVLGMSQNQ